MTNKKDFQNGCFSPNWLEVDLSDTNRVSKQEGWVDEYYEKGAYDIETEPCDTQLNKEVRLESQRRKDLNTLLKELDEIKKNIEHAAEKQHRLANLMGFYTGEFAQ